MQAASINEASARIAPNGSYTFQTGKYYGQITSTEMLDVRHHTYIGAYITDTSRFQYLVGVWTPNVQNINY